MATLSEENKTGIKSKLHMANYTELERMRGYLKSLMANPCWLWLENSVSYEEAQRLVIAIEDEMDEYDLDDEDDEDDFTDKVDKLMEYRGIQKEDKAD